MEPDEEWRAVVGAESRYEVSNLGNIRSKSYLKHSTNGYGPYSFWTKVKPISQATNDKGYLQVCLRLESGKDWGITAHRLVAQAFLPNPYDLPQVNHLDSTRKNNKLTNLEWCTAQENVEHSFMHGERTHEGESHPRSVLTDDIVRTIRELRRGGMPVTEIAKQVGRERSTVSKAVHGNNWSHVQ